MARKNSIEESEYRELIESKLKDGVSYRALAKELKELGVTISHMALQRYHTSKMGLSRTDVNQSANEELDISSVESLDLIDIKKETYKLQLSIVNQKMKLHIQGAGKFPLDEIRALKILDDITPTKAKTDNDMWQ